MHFCKYPKNTIFFYPLLGLASAVHTATVHTQWKINITKRINH